MVFLWHLIAGGILLVPAGGIASSPVPSGFVEGHLKIVSLKTVQLAEEKVSKSATVSYAEYPLLILSKDGRTEVTLSDGSNKSTA